MNNYQNQYFQNPKILSELQIQLQVENDNLKRELQQLNENLKIVIGQNQELKSQNEDLEKQVSILQQQLFQRDQDSIKLSKTLEEQRIFQEKQQELKNNCVELQQTNQKLQKQIDQLKQNTQILEIKCKPNVFLDIMEEIVHLRWNQQIDHLQFQYKCNKKIVEFRGYGEIKDKVFIFFQQCELLNIPLQEQKAQIIQKERELFIKFQI